jgi:hypothetical protein
MQEIFNSSFQADMAKILTRIFGNATLFVKQNSSTKTKIKKYQL